MELARGISITSFCVSLSARLARFRWPDIKYVPWGGPGLVLCSQPSVDAHCATWSCRSSFLVLCSSGLHCESLARSIHARKTFVDSQLPLRRSCREISCGKVPILMFYCKRLQHLQVLLQHLRRQINWGRLWCEVDGRERIDPVVVGRDLMTNRSFFFLVVCFSWERDTLACCLEVGVCLRMRSCIFSSLHCCINKLHCPSCAGRLRSGLRQVLLWQSVLALRIDRFRSPLRVLYYTVHKPVVLKALCF